MTHWLIPANTKFYDVFAAFERDETFWPMNAKLADGDTAYIYLTAPHKQIGFVCNIIEVGYDLDEILDEVSPFIKGKVDTKKAAKPFMKLKATHTIPIVKNSLLSLDYLKQHGLNGMLMGVRKLENNPELLAYIKTNCG